MDNSEICGMSVVKMADAVKSRHSEMQAGTSG